MPPKKKATPAVGVTSLPPGVKITWQLEDKRKAMWVVFSTEVQDGLTAAAMSCRKQLNLKAGPRSALTIDMVKMVQQTSKGAEKRVRGLVENKEVLISWEVKDGEEWQPLQVGVGARLEQVLEISSSVVVGGIKYDLDKMCRDDKTQVRREKQVVKNFMKSSITGNIKVAEKQEYDEEEEMSGVECGVCKTKLKTRFRKLFLFLICDQVFESKKQTASQVLNVHLSHAIKASGAISAAGNKECLTRGVSSSKEVGRSKLIRGSVRKEIFSYRKLERVMAKSGTSLLDCL